jgi:hypothetical protein
MLWNVKMSPQAKITVIVILGLGILYGFQALDAQYLHVNIVANTLSYYYSASIATLVRLNFIADLENIDDILCTLPSTLTPTHFPPRIHQTS